MGALALALPLLATIGVLNLGFNLSMPRAASQDVFPRALIRSLGGHVQTFYPKTNDGNFRNWVAVLGDSYAQGSGDAFLDNEPDYGIFHHLRRIDGQNYYIFGRGGFGTINAVREYLVTRREFDIALLYPKAEDPKAIEFVFYEGNDLDDNIKHDRARGKGRPATEFVASELDAGAGVLRWLDFYLPITRLLNPALLWELATRRGGRGGHSETALNTIVLDGGQSVPYPERPQGAAVDLTAAQLQRALEIFEAALDQLAARTHVPIRIVYLPSVVTPYRWQEPIRTQVFLEGADGTTTNAANLERSRQIRAAVARYASERGYGFVDATDMLVESGRHRLLHGPKDPKHFDARTQRQIAELLGRQPFNPARSASQP